MNIKSLNMSVFILLTLLLTGCATSYQPQAYSGGYSEKKLAENGAKITGVIFKKKNNKLGLGFFVLLLPSSIYSSFIFSYPP